MSRPPRSASRSLQVERDVKTTADAVLLLSCCTALLIHTIASKHVGFAYIDFRAARNSAKKNANENTKADDKAFHAYWCLVVYAACITVSDGQ